MSTTIKKIMLKENFERDDIVALLSADEPDDIELIRSSAESLLIKRCGKDVFYRGLIEFSNHCTRDCHYCGIRKSNTAVRRYILSGDEIVDAAKRCAGRGYGSIVLQSGERRDETFVDFLENVIAKIKTATVSKKLPKGLGITLSVGEQDHQTYERFFNAGAHRYLLRIETSNPDLFTSIHPPAQSREQRANCLRALKRIGYKVGTGVMIGIPGQTAENLANDILFFRNMAADMIGMGPYIPHNSTPMAVHADEHRRTKEKIFQTALMMIAVCRLVLKDVNIASTTALHTMRNDGRELGLRYGANVVMPQATPAWVRHDYFLYDGKPCDGEDTERYRIDLEEKIRLAGRNVAVDVWGDPRGRV